MNFWQRTEVFNPMLVRLLARRYPSRKCPVPLSTLEIADHAEMSPALTEAIAQSPSWGGVPVDAMRRFMYGCNLDLADGKAFSVAREYFLTSKTKAPPTFEYLRKSSNYYTYYAPLMIRWRRSYGVITPETKLWPPLRDLLLRLDLNVIRE